MNCAFMCFYFKCKQTILFARLSGEENESAASGVINKKDTRYTMPKKRKTRVLQSNVSRPTPQLPDGNQGQNLTKAQRREKLEVIIKDFEQEVEQRKKMMEQELEIGIRKINSAYALELTQIPKHVRKMKLSEYIKWALNRETEQENEDEDVSKVAEKTDSNVLSGEENESAASGVINKKDTRTRRLRTINSNNMLPPSGTAPPLSTVKAPGGRTIRKTRQKMYETPCLQMQSRAGWETPMVTPKFDPRLPFTPATARIAKPKEKLMSLAGSPVRSDHNLPGPLQFLATIKDLHELEDTDDTMIEALKELHGNLGRMLKTS